MSRQHSRYSRTGYEPTSLGAYQDDNSISPPPHHTYQHQQQQQQSYRNSRYDPDPHEYNNPFHSSSAEVRYDENMDSNRGYSDDQFNVASDFNNQGPRYGELYGGQSQQEMAQLAAGARPTSLQVHAYLQHDLNAVLTNSFGPVHGNRYNPLAPTTSQMDTQSMYSNSGMTKASGGGMKKPLLGETHVGGGPGDNVELVTVPALGAE